MGGVSYNCYIKLFDSLVWPVINYGAAIWGTRSYPCIDAVLNRACRFFVGVGQQAPVAAIQGDMGITPPLIRQYGEIIRQYRARILVQATIYRRLLIGRDGHLDQSEAYDIS